MNSDVFMLEGRAYSWRALCELRRRQLEAARKARGTQATLFELYEDRRPASQRHPSSRYAEPLLFECDARASGDS
jgi:hypothetical protein